MLQPAFHRGIEMMVYRLCFSPMSFLHQHLQAGLLILCVISLWLYFHMLLLVVHYYSYFEWNLMFWKRSHWNVFVEAFRDIKSEHRWGKAKMKKEYLVDAIELYPIKMIQEAHLRLLRPEYPS